MKVLFTVGLPASGKSTWAKNYCIKNKDWVRVCRDDLRHMRGQYWLPKQEDLISEWELGCILGALSLNKNVIVDATNLNPKYLASLKFNIQKISGKSLIFETKFFDVPVEECIKRDLKRENSVGEKVIRRMYNKYLKEDISIKQDKSLPKVVICDLDGTLAIMNGRSPYEYNKCDTDLVNEKIRTILWQTTGLTHHLIFMSGREDSCKEKTIEWLDKTVNISRKYDLYMRKTGDFRKDTIVKKELFEQYVKDKYYVDFILDDRSSVVKMWRDLGLTCLQVADGDF